ncbi:FAD-dependent monooxygenase, partial [Streptomyces actinomycinicus]
AAPDGRSRAVGMQAGTLDTLPTRGLAQRFIERGTPVPTGHFGAATTRLDLSTVGAVHPFMLALGQSVTEQLLEEHALAVGARVLRGEEVASLTEGPDTVGAVIRAAGPGNLHPFGDRIESPWSKGSGQLSVIADSFVSGGMAAPARSETLATPHS